MAVRFKLDENLPRDALALLVDAGHDVESVIDERLGGGPDRQVLDACREESRILVTLDLDFADIRLYPPAGHKGIWVLRPHTQSIRNTLTAAERSRWPLPHGAADQSAVDCGARSRSDSRLAGTARHAAPLADREVHQAREEAGSQGRLTSPVRHHRKQGENHGTRPRDTRH